MTFEYNELDYNTKAAKEIVPVLIQLLAPQSVIDVGCGIGTWLSVFQNLGVSDILGIDGESFDNDLISPFLAKTQFISHDLTKPFKCDRKFDLVISLEVAEHIPEDFADTFVETLVSLGDKIIFSAAIPYQDGRGHINEQWPNYWFSKFHQHNFQIHDCIRPIFWSNENVNWWYKQNIFLFTKFDENPIHINNDDLVNPLKIVHPELYYKKINRIDKLTNHIENLYSGQISVGTAIQILLRSIKRKIRLK
jgi:SAM-dependent methyltransferase